MYKSKSLFIGKKLLGYPIFIAVGLYLAANIFVNIMLDARVNVIWLVFFLALGITLEVARCLKNTGSTL